MSAIALFKLGGSLLVLPDLAERLRPALSQVDARPLFVVGGGPAADIVRQWDRIHQLGDEPAHWLALEAMSLNESLVSRLLPNARLVQDRRQALAAWSDRCLPILSSAAFLRQEEPGADVPLPHNWDVTSDSIAAWVAMRWPAQTLVLLKAVDLDVTREVGGAASGVDACFRRLAAELSDIRWVNLRRAPKEVVRWPGRIG